MSLIVKYVLPIVGVLAALFGVYEYGHSNGYDSGYTVAWNKQQTTIQGMVNAQNAQTNVQNAKISSLEQNSMKDAQDLFAAKAAAVPKLQAVIQTYTKANPVVAQSCGWDVPTVQAINDMIDAEPVNAAIPTSSDPVNTGTAVVVPEVPASQTQGVTQ